MVSPRVLRMIPAIAVLAVLTAACSSSTTTSSHTSAPPTSAPTAGSSPTHPIPLGQTGDAKGWKVKVVSLMNVPKDDSGNSPPPGYAWMKYTLQATRTDSQPQAAYMIGVVLLGPSKTERDALSKPYCAFGTLPTDKVHQGGTVTTGKCVSVPTSDVGDLVLGIGSTHTLWFATK